ncbi:MAG: hypothetical protein JST00_19775 [Deltaproteobacteria bacterium]|nr:hypothetical protein [Deltaproteobacteria bacterium]
MTSRSSSLGFGAVGVLLGAIALIASASCSSTNTTPLADGGTSGGSSGSCEGAPTLTKADFCSSCTFSDKASPNTCKAPRTVNACCTYVQAPSQELARGTGLVRNSSTDPKLDLGCLDAPPALGTPKNVTIKGFVRVFSSGGDSAGVKVEIFKEGANGALGEPVGTPAITSDTGKFYTDAQGKKPDYLKKCPDGGCTFREFTYTGVPTETPLIVKTSDANNGSTWASFYDYNVYFANGTVKPGDEVYYEPAAVAATDINTVASAAGGFTVKQDKGLLAGEVHDCADVRVSGAMVDTDIAHEGEMFYFGDNEADPLPDKSRSSQGTSKLGTFGTLNLATGTPMRVSAVGKVNGQTVLLGTYTVQTFPGAVTALSFRGRRPWQK